MKKLIPRLLVVILGIVFVCFIPSIRESREIKQLQEKLEVNKQARLKCEQVMASGHQENEAIRLKLVEKVGLVQESSQPIKSEGVKTDSLQGQPIE